MISQWNKFSFAEEISDSALVHTTMKIALQSQDSGL